MNDFFIMKKRVDKSTLYQGVSIPVMFQELFYEKIGQCFLDNNESFAKLFNDPDFYHKVQDAMAAELYKALRRD